MILNKKSIGFALLRRWVVVLLVVLISGCEAGNAKIASRKGYVRFSGKQYASGQKAKVGEKIEGEASYYGPGFDGKKTASGEIFNQNDFTCAHRTFPFGTKLKVVRKDTGASVIVRVNDRGPFAHKRILDLSVAAAKKIGLDKAGHAKVTATVVD